MVVMGKMDYLVQDLLTSFEQDVIKELNKQRLDAIVTILKHNYLIDKDEEMLVNIGIAQFKVSKQGNEITIRAPNATYEHMYNIEVLVTYIKNFAKDQLEQKIKYLEKKRKQLGD